MPSIVDKCQADINNYVAEAFAGSAAIRRMMYDATVHGRQIDIAALRRMVDEWHRIRRSEQGG